MKKCFVIQPFDKDKFDRRYNDIYKPAIEKAGLEPYRIDNDPSVRILIDEIEKGIQSANIIFADITLDNPNVWYELGFSFAQQKDIVMVCCTDERKNDFPFDIRHRTIITYKARSKSDFESLEYKIHEKIVAYLNTAKTVDKIINLPVNEIEGLQSHEIALLLLLVEGEHTPFEPVSAYFIKPAMTRTGYNSLALNMGIRTLVSKEFLTIVEMYDEGLGETYMAYKLTSKGEDWVINNQHLMNFGV